LLATEGMYGAQMFVLNRDLGRLRAMAPVVRRMIDDPQSNLWTPGLMMMCCEVGLLDQARLTFDKLAVDDFSSVSRDDLWVISIAFCAETCAQLEDTDRALSLYDLLLPYAEQTAIHPPAVCVGSLSMYLGLLAQLSGRLELARTHFEYATEKNRAMGAWPALARCELHLARLLLASELATDQDAGKGLLADVEQLASRFKMTALMADAAAVLDSSAIPLPDDLTPREAEVLKLLAIGRSNKDISKVLSISLSTVATHVRSILNKSGCANRTEAARYAMRHELN
jgi:DNA-binding CsgD family transcriptional regulator